MKTRALAPILAAIAVLLFTACCTPKKSSSARPALENIDTAKASVLVRDNASNPDFKILDVRTPAEFAAGHIPGAVNINIGSADFVSELEKLDRSKLYLVACRSGSRSARALDIMGGMGFTNVRNLFGGMIEWEAAGLPVAR